ncbi:hypothetical protein K474DRAFT_184261 [Panus rudis PR-1116 ss-1]|nr:hypothetical protein K474DRAFT_184261 [Panus rudis PR-1116 ss-1]
MHIRFSDREPLKSLFAKPSSWSFPARSPSPLASAFMPYTPSVTPRDVSPAMSLTSFVVEEPAEAKLDWRIYLYATLHLLGGLGLTLLLCTMLWPSKPRRTRNPLLISLCLSWWITPFPCVMFLYYVGQIAGPPPSQGICLASAVMTMGQPILVATTAPALAFNPSSVPYSIS